MLLGDLFCSAITFRNARRKMSPGSGDEPPIVKSRLGKKSQVVEDEKVDGEYGLVINGHSLVREPCSMDKK